MPKPILKPIARRFLTLGICGAITLFALIKPGNKADAFILSYPSIAPWRSIGGCGVGSGGTGNGAGGIRWIGTSLNGTLLDCEITANTTIQHAPDTAKQVIKSVQPVLNFHPAYMDLSLALPYFFKSKELSSQIFQTAGFGDLGFTLSKKWGMEGRLTTSLALSFPTGPSDLYSHSGDLYSPDLQLGTGRFGGSLIADYSRDFSWGNALISASYTGGLLYLKTTDFTFDLQHQYIQPLKKELAFARNGFTASNDMGVTSADNLGLAAYAGFKLRRLIQDLGVSVSVPLADNSYYDYLYQDRLTNGRGVFYYDTNMSKPAAQSYLDTAAYYKSAAWQNTQKTIIGPASNGRWVVRKGTETVVNNNPVVSLQYGFEVPVSDVPVFVGFLLPLTINTPRHLMIHNISVQSVSATLGIRIPTF